MKRIIPLLLALFTLGCSPSEAPSISLYLAVQRGDIEQVDRHLHWGTDINQAFPNGSYPLHDAAANGRLILLRKLIKAGAKLDAKDSQAHSALDVAILNGRTQLAEALIKAGADYEPSALLLLTAQRSSNDRDIVRFLKSHGADLNITDGAGNSPLLIAAQQKNFRLVRHLVELGADVNLQNQQGDTALDIAQGNNDEEAQRFLLRYGATNGKP